MQEQCNGCFQDPRASRINGYRALVQIEDIFQWRWNCGFLCPCHNDGSQCFPTYIGNERNHEASRLFRMNRAVRASPKYKSIKTDVTNTFHTALTYVRLVSLLHVHGQHRQMFCIVFWSLSGSLESIAIAMLLHCNCWRWPLGLWTCCGKGWGVSSMGISVCGWSGDGGGFFDGRNKYEKYKLICTLAEKLRTQQADWNFGWLHFSLHQCHPHHQDHEITDKPGKQKYKK